MCGIAGRLAPQPLLPARAATLRTAMRNRGPDANGCWSGQIAGLACDLLHSRLAVLDLDPRSDQPFIDDDCVLIINGEIYNYRELRAELIALGDRFRTESDTEVVLRAYRRFGKAAFARFEGMWALALVDRRTDEVILGRDAFGEKPLLVAKSGDEIVFGSETKYLSMLAGRAFAPNLRQIRRYLVNGYKSLFKGDESYFHGIEEVPAGCYRVWSHAGLSEPVRYWRPRFERREMSLAEAEVGTRERMERALELRLRADVPIAFCLSGGVDSTVLAALAVRRFDYDVHAFSIVDSDPRYDESALIKATVAQLGCRHDVVHTSREGFLDRLAAQVAYHGAPVATISYYLHEFLSEVIASHGYKVAVSGTAADEIFTGYYDHYGFWLAAMGERPEFPKLMADWNEGYGATVRNPLLRDPLALAQNPGQRGHIYLDRAEFNAVMVEPLDEDFSEESYCAETLRNRMANELLHEVVPVILREDDLNSMRFSVENRSVYLDRDLVDFAFSVPQEHLIHDGMPKWLLRNAARGLAPDEVLFAKQKRGFNASIDSLLDRNDPDVRERLLSDGPIFEVVDRTRFQRWLDADLTDNSFSKFMFSFVSAKLFLEGDLAQSRRAQAA
jgi:asparagine synthase (glutamine-hydrolysing)